jgi:hypothetical protein
MINHTPLSSDADDPDPKTEALSPPELVVVNFLAPLVGIAPSAAVFIIYRLINVGLFPAFVAGAVTMGVFVARVAEESTGTFSSSATSYVRASLCICFEGSIPPAVNIRF